MCFAAFTGTGFITLWGEQNVAKFDTDFSTI